MQWKVLSTEYLFQNPPWLTVRKEKCELPNGTIMPAYYTLEYPEWTSAFALTKENKVIMVQQYRHGLGQISIELPGGVVEKGETTATAIARELREETGFEFESYEYLGKISANPATTNNYMHMYIARGGVQTGEQKLDDTEDLEVNLHSIEEIKQLLKDNKIVQALHTATIFYALARIGALSY